ncbi:MAG: amino acid ABC transporter ATP-binding protein [Firmicutes bacterium]|nr:amino acid ABC transporter ATP-binding protein [Bacillota bacterium]
MIQIKHLQKAYSNITPLKDVCVDIHRGDVISIIGPSGTGKSTLIRCINMLEKPTSGEIWVNGQCITDKKCDISKVRQKMGMVFQSFNLFPHLTVIENIMKAPVDLLGKSRQQAYDDGMQLLRMVGLADKAFNYPDNLSGGQKQRVAIARTLAMEPEIILFDEPTSALDPTMVGEVQAVIRDLARKGLTMMIVTHEMSFAREIANRVFYMDDGDIYEDGTPEQIFDHPQKERTIHFIRRLKVHEAYITSRDFDFLGLVSELEEFGRKNQVSQKTIYRMQTVFEELCVQIILPQLSGDFSMSVITSYSQQDEQASMQIKYSGNAFDPADTENVLSMKLAQNAAKEIVYTPIQEDAFRNRVDLIIK